MSLKHRGMWLALGLLVALAASPLMAQPPEGQVVGDMQLFASGEQATLGGGPRANQGLFVTASGLLWYVSPPNIATFGQPLPNARTVYWGSSVESSQTLASTVDTSFITAQDTGGQEYTIGWIKGHQGIMFRYFDLHELNAENRILNVPAYFEDEVWGDGGFAHTQGQVGTTNPTTQFLPTYYEQLTLRNTTKSRGVELSYLYRLHPMMGGGIFEWKFGARYIAFLEEFDVEGFQLTDPEQAPPHNVLADTVFATWADNYIVGPEIGLRWFRRQDRWTWEAMGAFTAGTNFQAIRQEGEVASLQATTFGDPIVNTPLAQRGTGFNHSFRTTEFSPVVEFQVNLKYQFTRSVAGNIGYSALWINNVARPSNMVDYTLHNDSYFGILEGNNRQDVLMHGLRAGIEFNR